MGYDLSYTSGADSKSDILATVHSKFVHILFSTISFYFVMKEKSEIFDTKLTYLDYRTCFKKIDSISNDNNLFVNNDWKTLFKPNT